MTQSTLLSVLASVIDLVKQSGDWLAAEFSRPAGPRFSDTDTAPIDHEIEMFLRERLTALLPARFVGEEAGVLAAEANGYCWVVDPHDGTRAFLEGRRGSAISVALLRRGVPVLGVVYAPLSPDRGPDLIAWAEGGGITRNGESIDVDLSSRGLTDTDVVWLNHGAGQRPVWNSTACAPARFMALPSIAYRLARVAAGDGVATVTLRPVNAHDIAAGHALLTAAGGVLVTEDGAPVTYGIDGDSRPSACFGGAPEAVAILRTRTWRVSSGRVSSGRISSGRISSGHGIIEPRREPMVTLTWPRVPEGQRFDRALGCMLGMVIGDSLGSLVEFSDAGAIAAHYPGGVRDLAVSPVWQTIAGQPTDDSELGLTLARTLVQSGQYDPEAAAAAYGAWYASQPFDCGHATRLAFSAAARAPIHKARAASAAADAATQSNGSLMRIAPIGVWAGDPQEAARIAIADSGLSHPHPVCRIACAAFVAAIATSLSGGGRGDMMQTALRVAEQAGADAEPVSAALRRAALMKKPADYQHQMGWVLTSLQNAFYHLAIGNRMEPAVIETVAQGGDTDTNAAIVGALLGAADGRASLPGRWVLPVLTCRPGPGMRAARPRPDVYWPADILDLTEGLLLQRGLPVRDVHRN